MIALPIILFMLAAMFNAIMDVAEFHPHRLPKWWRHDWRRKYVDGDPKKGRVKIGKTKINKPVQIIDGWHFSKMMMVICLAGAVTSAMYVNVPNWYWVLHLTVVSYIAWNGTFVLFYKHIL